MVFKALPLYSLSSKLQRFIVCKMIFAKNLQFYKKYITLDNSSSHYDRHTFMSDTEIIVVFLVPFVSLNMITRNNV